MAGTAGHVIVATFGEDSSVDGQIPVNFLRTYNLRQNLIIMSFGHEKNFFIGTNYKYCLGS